MDQDYLSNIDESKIYGVNYDSSNNPRDYDDFTINGKLTNIPCSSEYTANGETFRLTNGDLSNIWRKNPIRAKWGYQNSLSSNDYPYLLNNSFLSDDFNRTTNPFDPIPDRKERNLDYFYSVNSSTHSYSYHSLHVESVKHNSIDTGFNFDLSQYLNVDYDYFSSFFGKKSLFNGEITNTQKWSIFEKGDKVNPNTTLFRGLKFNLYDVEDIKSIDGGIDTINLRSSNSYQGYKFSILLSKNNLKVIPSKFDISIGMTLSSSNMLSWNIIDNWTHNKDYTANTMVSYYDILYKSSYSSTIIDPSKNPSTESEWNTISTWSPTYSIFWTPNYSFSSNDFIYNSGEYYYYHPTGNTFSFWKPFQSYGYNDVVAYNNRTWISSTQSNVSQPGSSAVWRNSALSLVNNYYWNESTLTSDWRMIEIWSPISVYYTNSINKSNGDIILVPGNPYAIYTDILYQLSLPTGQLYSSDDIPGISTVWIRKYSMVPDTDYPYNATNNPIIFQNNRYYQCLSNSNNSTLENGINIYINKKYRNVLINIYVNDNTLSNLSNSDRDEIYSDMYSKITATNFTNAIGDISNKFGYSDYLQYVIINEDGALNTYNFNNINSLVCMIVHQPPDQFFSRCQSLTVNSLSLESSQFKSKRHLENGDVVSIDMIDYYNNNSLSTEINKRTDDPSIIDNYHGLKNNIYNTMYRHSGYYCPIFYTIPLFESPGMTNSIAGNYKFDTTLTNFGIVKERVISKINRNSNILKLRSNPDIKSIYPMIDEFGYTTSDYFIFKSTWDNEFYIECIDIDQNG